MARVPETTPLYVRIATVLRQRIEAGEFSVGAMLPTLEAFMQEFSASRVTIRLAMDVLEADRLISRRRGFGTIVVAQPRAEAQVALPNSWDELLARLSRISRTKVDVRLGQQPSSDELNLAAHPGLPSALLSVPASSRRRGNQPSLRVSDEPARYVHLVARHDHGRAAYCHVDGWLEATLYAASKRQLRSRPTLQVLVSEHADRVVRVLQSTTLGVADLAVADSLEIPIGSPVALVRRTVFDANGLRVYASRISFPAAVVRWDSTLVTG